MTRASSVHSGPFKRHEPPSEEPFAHVARHQLIPPKAPRRFRYHDGLVMCIADVRLLENFFDLPEIWKLEPEAHLCFSQIVGSKTVSRGRDVPSPLGMTQRTMMVLFTSSTCGFSQLSHSFTDTLSHTLFRIFRPADPTSYNLRLSQLPNL